LTHERVVDHLGALDGREARDVPVLHAQRGSRRRRRSCCTRGGPRRACGCRWCRPCRSPRM
jgi:hypothetical protein